MSTVKDKIQKAQLLYFSGHTITEIATITEMPIDSIRMLAFGDDGTARSMTCWKSLKSRMDPCSIASYILDKKAILERTSGLAVAALNKSLETLNGKIQSGELELSISDMKELAGIVFGMDKIVRLESGTATDIISKIGLTPAEAREILRNDPFAKSVVNMEVEYAVIDEKGRGESNNPNGNGKDYRDSDNSDQ